MRAMSTPSQLPLLGRREALLTLGAGLGALYGLRGLLQPREALSASSCLLQREVTAGPYDLDLGLVRRNIRGDRVTGSEVHTGQAFFRPAVQHTVYSQGGYASRGQPDVTNASDSIYREAGARALMTLRRKGHAVGAGHTGSLTVGVNPSA